MLKHYTMQVTHRYLSDAYGMSFGLSQDFFNWYYDHHSSESEQFKPIYYISGEKSDGVLYFNIFL